MVITMLPLTVLLNSFLFGKRYFTEWHVLLFATVATFLFLAGSFIIYGKVALVLRNRFPEERQTVKRMALSIIVFVIMSAVLLSFVFRGYAFFNFLGYTFNEYDFTRAFISVAIVNIFLTFLNEGIAKFDSYKATVTETEELKNEYMKSQLLGLKSQVNPHFLFNSLNTLSCLIHDDAEKAERFVDEMTRVYRYLLKGNEQQLVSVETEIGMLRSYFYLLKERYGPALDLVIDVNEDECRQQIPPLTLQILFEYIINTNTIRKEEPLYIELRTAADCRLVVSHNIQNKLCCPEEKDLMALDNTIKKFKLLSRQDVVIAETDNRQSFSLPLIGNNENVEV